MAEYGLLKDAKIDRLYNLAKTNGGIVIAPYSSTLSESENIQRVYALRKQIMHKAISFFPIFCTCDDEEKIMLGKTCFLIINKRKSNISTDPYISRDELFQFGKELCKDYNKEVFDFIENGEIRTYSKNGNCLSLYCPGVMLNELINIAIYNNKTPDKSNFYIRTCRTVMEFTSKGLGGELFLWEKELPYCKEKEETTDFI